MQLFGVVDHVERAKLSSRAVSNGPVIHFHFENAPGALIRSPHGEWVR